MTGEFRDWLLSRVNVTAAGYTTPCWLWTGRLSDKGYARQYVPIGLGGTPKKPVRIHRLAYQLLVGPIAEGLVTDHRCRNRSCVNPEHLEIVTVAVNNARIFDPNATAPLTHCCRGHEFTPENTEFRRGRRDCLTCRSMHSRSLAERRRAA